MFVFYLLSRIGKDYNTFIFICNIRMLLYFFGKFVPLIFCYQNRLGVRPILKESDSKNWRKYTDILAFSIRVYTDIVYLSNTIMYLLILFDTASHSRTELVFDHKWLSFWRYANRDQLRI